VGIFLFIVGLVLLCVAGGLFFYGSGGGPGAAKIGGCIALVFALGFGWYGLSLTTVDARSVGIETRGGKFVAVHKPGRHVTAPWASVEQWTTRNQAVSFKYPVRLANQSKADVTGTITWAVADSGGDWAQQVERVKQLWNAYKTFDDMKSKYADPTARGVVGDLFNLYDPFKGQGAVSTDNPVISYAEWSKKVTEALGPLYAKTGLTLILVQVTDIDYDDDTENKIKAVAEDHGHAHRRAGRRACQEAGAGVEGTVGAVGARL
jgi:hypothetical protein